MSTTTTTTVTISDNDLNSNDPSTWVVGIEKMLAASPTGFRDVVEEMGLDDYLGGLADDHRGCRSFTWTGVYRHTGASGVYSGKLLTDSCNVRGCPTCREDKARRDLKRHIERLDVAYPEPGDIVRVNLATPARSGHADTKEGVRRFLRRKAVKDIVEPTVFGYGASSSGGYGVTLLAPSVDYAESIGALWTEVTDGSFGVTETEVSSALEAAVDLRVEIEAGVFELVGEGVVDPATARTWVYEEKGSKRFSWTGGFLECASNDDVEDTMMVGRDDEDDLGVDDEDVCLTADDDYVGWVREQAATLRCQYEDGGMADLVFERNVRRLAGDHPSNEVKRIVNALLSLLPDSYFTCRMHERCNLEPTDRKIKTRFIREQVQFGNAEWDAGEELFTWTDTGWPGWRRSSVPLRAGDGEGDE